MAKNHEELDQYGSMSLDPPASPQYYEGGRGSEGIEERDSIMEESDSDTIGRSALEVCILLHVYRPVFATA
ncbi:uncharacterized protein ARB_06608 [Trichophyton benhamiae CBS 112371]|uniref:Uncharacterized protein n=1 Tax=Arthroderma benhamiae (strain ATCC MYA-4681 / CBS 112371) TaxID=663331 RepID=D4AQU8_ARTBC|nr:uncharacterized protein ARB_06608 [Trichophyton benhamiae CBS 112371]EFE34842.1 hypothetical protein ARB_06608 [Trichophyton benhamiae CBS 112371]